MQVVPPILWIIFATIFGAILGSYVNMAAYRLPRLISTVTKTRSFCPSCKTQLCWYENLPIMSYLALRGKCRTCKNPISSRYLWVEVLVAALFALAAYQFFDMNSGIYGVMPPAVFVVQLFLIVDLVLLSVVDLEMWIIPWQTTLPWIVVGLIVAPIFPELHASATKWYQFEPRTNALIDSFTGLALGAGAPWAVGVLTTLISFCWFKLRKDPRRPLEGMGDGDTHLMGMVGAMLGWKPALITLFLGVVIGATTGIAKIWWERFKHWRLGDKYKPWQPTYDVELPPENQADSKPSFWLLLVFGMIVLLTAGYLYERSTLSWDGPPIRSEDLGEPVLFRMYDVRLLPVLMMFLLSILLVVAYLFKSYLARTDQLPQGDIVEKADGKKEEVLEGNYVPFGPSLALGALIVAFYDPLLRAVAYWFATGANQKIPALPYRFLADATLMHVLTTILKAFNELTQKMVSG
jgi:leader peptidase (prepilin peptidase)/N-methyltransferase